MNIQKIFNAKIVINTNTPEYKNSGVRYSNFGLKMPRAIERDTVSFQSRASKVVIPEVQAAFARKQARHLRDMRLLAELKAAPEKSAQTKKELQGEERTWGVSISTSQQIRNSILPAQRKIHDFMNRIFGDMRVSDISPKNLILDISDRAKSVVSIMEKSSTRKWNSVKEILENMTDLNGAKIVMNYKTGKQEVDTVLDRLIPLIKTKQIKLVEIELQRPIEIKKLSKKEQEEYDYASSQFLDRLEDAQEEVINGLETDVDKIKLIERPLPKYSKGNYCALHLLLELNEKGSRPFEVQIMGAREAKGKKIDDKRFKFFDGKELDKKYTRLEKLWGQLKIEENEDAKQKFLKYCADANFQLREDELHEYATKRLINRSTGFFKRVKEYNLPYSYDLNEQYKLMELCEAQAENKNSKGKDIIFEELVQTTEILEKSEKREYTLPQQAVEFLYKKINPKKPKNKYKIRQN